MARTRTPDWRSLYTTASQQAGCFTLKQAQAAGVSQQLVHHHVTHDTLIRVLRGVFRVAEFPEVPHGDLVPYWLWSDRIGVFSHETALYLHGLTTRPPARTTMTLPAAETTRRVVVPDGLALYYDDLPRRDVVAAPLVPITSVARTLFDCEHAGTSPRTLAAAAEKAVARQLLSSSELVRLKETPRQRRGSGR